jgi:hypothetical protein
MMKPSPLNGPERDDLVAYLDGELSEERSRAIEARLNVDPAARAEAEALRRTWDLLDYLPRPEPSSSFTHRTLERLAPVTGRQPAVGRWPMWKRGLFGAGWAAALVVAAVGGSTAFFLAVPPAPRPPGEAELVRDLMLIENKRLYDVVEDVDYLRDLDQVDLFAEETRSSLGGG